jgi:hypothetical protein
MQAQKAEIEFDLVVPEKGTVTGHLYYFPFENERETVPMDRTQQQQPPPATGAAGALVLTQQPAGTQLALTQGPARSSPEPEGEAQCYALTLLLLHTSAVLLA